ncbi:hypothetical protein [Pectinatus haikarae]|uniref:Uncharacterized protein n=1 Tax=Pectinatus haikarae TaxID=349096 RepID=A0ABT9Y760_9FIRM|nr:hypothetical protein [Pectinatus haikarae]MDQ0203473.1 hypothetical protein [Pectinatus haikarae]
MKHDLFFAGIGMFIVILLFAGYRYLPQRRVFYLFTAIVLCGTGAVFLFWNGQTQNNNMTEEQRMQILSEQPFFITWYEEYKQYVEEIDRIWMRYNNALDEFSAQKISMEDMNTDLLKIQADSDELRNELEKKLPPQELSDENYRLVYEVLEKTRQYLAAENSTIKMTVQMMQIPQFKMKAVEEQYRELDNIRILNSPVNLNAAGDISSVRDNLSLPDL